MQAREHRFRKPANDAALVQAVRTALGRDERLRRGTKINVSSCSFVASLHGTVADRDLRGYIGRRVLEVPGVEGVKNELRVAEYPVLGVQEKG